VKPLEKTLKNCMQSYFPYSTAINMLLSQGRSLRRRV